MVALPSARLPFALPIVADVLCQLIESSFIKNLLSFIMYASSYRVLRIENIIAYLSVLFKVVRLPLKLKYACPSQSTWKLVVDSLFTVIHNGLSMHLEKEAQGEVGTCSLSAYLM